jgi:hypothetical protein
MPLSVEKIVEETRPWPADAIADLVDRIMIARHGGIDPTIDECWRTEIRHRIDDIRTGREAGIPGDATMTEARKMIGR